MFSGKSLQLPENEHDALKPGDSWDEPKRVLKHIFPQLHTIHENTNPCANVETAVFHESFKASDSV